MHIHDSATDREKCIFREVVIVLFVSVVATLALATTLFSFSTLEVRFVSKSSASSAVARSAKISTLQNEETEQAALGALERLEDDPAFFQIHA